MFGDLHSPAADLATRVLPLPKYPRSFLRYRQALADENNARFRSFSAADAVTLGLSIRKRFRSTPRHAKGHGLIISIQTIAGHPLFACTVGDAGQISLESWNILEGIIKVVKSTSRSSFYVEQARAATGKQLEMQSDYHVTGGAFPIWLENAPCCPIAIAACYSGASAEDHRLVATTVRDYLQKMRDNSPSRPASTVGMTLQTGQVNGFWFALPLDAEFPTQ
ncbi:hypothetical protein MKEN_00067300 [Mycena kentingensis (nom. inval.)]|nr:hypothetical protein MKEN_00067300 [Mycena kentingensis (nom. inval.)]